VRPSGGDFAKGSTISAPRRLRPTDLALAAAMNQPRLQVGRKPIVALIATGDELVQPGETPRPDQIIASNTYGLKAMIEAEGGLARVLPIAKDTVESLSGILSLAQDADLIVTIGGASVGDHDLVAQVAGSLGLERAFYKIAMRPGKPLMAGRLGQAQLLGLPGNPVSSMVCGHLFLVPMIHAYLGLPTGPRATKQAILAEDLGPNGPRQHYMRAQLSIGDGLPVVTPFERQDSSLISVLAGADALMIRPANQAALSAGALVDIIPL
jgi:molybdopterin molybdotransferase